MNKNVLKRANTCQTQTSLVQGPLLSLGWITFCQWCKNCTSVRPGRHLAAKDPTHLSKEEKINKKSSIVLSNNTNQTWTNCTENRDRRILSRSGNIEILIKTSLFLSSTFHQIVELHLAKFHPVHVKENTHKNLLGNTYFYWKSFNYQKFITSQKMRKLSTNPS